MDDVTKLVAALHEAIPGMPRTEAAALLAQLAGVIGAVGARLAGGAPGDAPVAEECLTIGEVAQRIKLGKSTIRAMIASGRLEEGIHYHRVGRRLIFFWSSIMQFLTSRPPLPPVSHREAIPFVRRGRRRG